MRSVAIHINAGDEEDQNTVNTGVRHDGKNRTAHLWQSSDVAQTAQDDARYMERCYALSSDELVWSLRTCERSTA